MTPEFVMTIGHRALEVATLMMMMLLIPALIVGLMVSMFQAATQINEATLSFIPKLLITMAVLAVAGPFLLRVLTDFTRAMFDTIPMVVG